MAYPTTRRFAATFSALQYPNYRLWFYGQLVSLVGTWMQFTAQGYLAFHLTSSPAYLGIVSFANGVPSWIFMLYGGLVADRISRRTLLILTQIAMMVPAFILAGLVFSGLVQPWHIVVLSFLLGIANAFDAPTRQAFVVELVEREAMTNAIALNSTMFNGAAVIGPVAAGLAYAWVGPGWCFTINGLSFIAVIIALWMMRLDVKPPPPARESALVQIKEGVVYAFRNPSIRVIIMQTGFVALFAVGVVSLLPAWAVQVLHGDAATNGYLISGRGLGSVLGALMVATLSRYQREKRIWSLGVFALPLALFILPLQTSLLPSVLILLLLGFSTMMVLNTSNAMIQRQTVDSLRGRVMSIYTLVFYGLVPLGSLLVGWLATWWNEQTAVVICAAMLLLGAAVTMAMDRKNKRSQTDTGVR